MILPPWRGVGACMASSDKVNPVAMPVENHRQPLRRFRYSHAVGPRITIDCVMRMRVTGMPSSKS